MSIDNKHDPIEACLSYYRGQRDRSEQQTVVQLLRELQEMAGFLTKDLRQRAAAACNIKESVIELYIRIYPDLKAADYHHEIVACTGARCAQKGGVEVLAALRHTLGIPTDGLSADGRILLKTQNCLKACATSPNLKIDGRLYTNVRPKDVSDILEKACK